MPRRRIILVLTALCLVCAVFSAEMTGAWFVAGGRLGGAEYGSAEVVYLPPWDNIAADDAEYGALIDGSTEQVPVFIVPGNELLKTDANSNPIPLSIENFSTTPTNVRLVADVTVQTFDTATNTMTDVTGFEWYRVSQGTSSTVYQYGKFATIDGVQVFMGMLQFNFYNGTYNWQKNADVSNAWDFYYDVASSNTVVPVLGNDRQKYTAIQSIQVVGNSLDVQYQTDYNNFFSQNFAGSTIKLDLKYYAKQNQFMDWQQFSESLLTLGL